MLKNGVQVISPGNLVSSNFVGQEKIRPGPLVIHNRVNSVRLPARCCSVVLEQG